MTSPPKNPAVPLQTAVPIPPSLRDTLKILLEEELCMFCPSSIQFLCLYGLTHRLRPPWHQPPQQPAHTRYKQYHKGCHYIYRALRHPNPSTSILHAPHYHPHSPTIYHTCSSSCIPRRPGPGPPSVKLRASYISIPRHRRGTWV